MKKGGKIIGKGADTCVFKPEVKCMAGQSQITGIKPGESYVSRIMLLSSNEHVLQSKTYNIIKQELEAAGKFDDYMRFFLFGAYWCGPATTPDDFKDDITDPTTTDYRSCIFRNNRVISKNNPPIINSSNPNQRYINIVTPVYSSDLVKNNALVKSKDVTREGIYSLAMVLTYVNNIEKGFDDRFIHSDAHYGNVGWKGNQIILSDWGRVKTGLDAENLVTDTMQNIESPSKQQDIEERKVQYLQYYYPYTLLQKLEKRSNFVTKYVVAVWDILAILGPMGNRSYKILPEPHLDTFCTNISNLIKVVSAGQRESFESKKKLSELEVNLKTSEDTSNTMVIRDEQDQRTKILLGYYISITKQKITDLQERIRLLEIVKSNDYFKYEVRKFINTLFGKQSNAVPVIAPAPVSSAVQIPLPPLPTQPPVVPTAVQIPLSPLPTQPPVVPNAVQIPLPTQPPVVPNAVQIPTLPESSSLQVSTPTVSAVSTPTPPVNQQPGGKRKRKTIRNRKSSKKHSRLR